MELSKFEEKIKDNENLKKKYNEFCTMFQEGNQPKGIKNDLRNFFIEAFESIGDSDPDKNIGPLLGNFMRQKRKKKEKNNIKKAEKKKLGNSSKKTMGKSPLERLPFEEITDLVLSQFPSPIALPYASFLNESGVKLNPNWNLAFNRLIDLYEITMVFCSTMAVESYCKAGLHTTQADQAIIQLRDNDKLSTGFWWQLFREVNRAFRTVEDGKDAFASEMANFYFKKGKVKTTQHAALIDAIPNIRNQMKGHTWTPSSDQLKSLVEKHGPNLATFLEGLNFLSNYRLFRVSYSQENKPHGKGFTHDIELFLGAFRFPERRSLTTLCSLMTNQIYLIHEDDFFNSQADEEDILKMHPFVIYEKDRNASLAELFLFQSKTKKCIHYMSVIDAGRLENEENLQHFNDLLKNLKTESADFIGKFQQKAREKAEKYLEQMQNENVFQPHIYIKRQDVESHFEKFLESSKNAILLIGPSGIGKTNMLCNRLHSWLSEGKENETYVLLPAAALPSDIVNQPLSRIVTDHLGYKDDLGKLLTKMHENGNKSKQNFFFYLFVDAVDRYSHPEKLMQAVLKLIETHKDFPLFKIVITCSENAYEAMQEGKDIILSPNQFYTVHLQQQSESDGKENDEVMQTEVKFGFLTDNEIEHFYKVCQSQPGLAPRNSYEDLRDSSALNSLRNPLLFKLALQVYDGKEIPDKSIAGEVLLDYSKRKIFNSPSRSNFINHLVDFMIDEKTRLAPFEKIVTNSQLRDSLLNEKKSSPYRQLLDEQILVELQKPYIGNLDLVPERVIEFAYDKLLEYLVLTRMAKRFDLTEETIKRMSKDALQFPAFKGALYFYLQANVENSDFEKVVNAINGGYPDTINEVVKNLLLEFVTIDSISKKTDSNHFKETKYGQLTVQIIENLTYNGIKILIYCIQKLIDRRLVLNAEWTIDQLKKESNLTEFADLKAELLIQEGRYILIKGGKRKEALSIFEKTLDLLDNSSSSLVLKADIFYRMGSAYETYKNYKKAEKCFEEAQKIYENFSDLAGKAKILNCLGGIERDKGRLKNAKKIFSEAKEIFNGLNDKNGLANVNLQLAIVYVEQRNINKALEHFENALNMQKQTTNRPLLAKIYYNLGKLCALTCSFTEAFKFFSIAMEKFHEINDTVFQSKTYQHISDLYTRLGFHEDAFKTLKQSYDIRNNQTKSKEGISKCKLRFGKLKTQFFNYADGLNDLNSALSEYIEMGNICEIAHCNLELGQFYSKNGDIEKSIEHLKQASGDYADLISFVRQSDDEPKIQEK